MKKSILCITATILLFSLAPAQVNASSNADAISVVFPTVPVPTKSEVLVARLNEIKAIDKSLLNTSERKELRKESRSIKRELKQLSGGVYVSAGALILIAVLLIILL